MFIGLECFTLPRRLLIPCFLLCQLTWIFPCTFFLLNPSSPPKLLVVQGRNASRRIHSKGAAGPFMVLTNGDLSLLRTTHEEWITLWPKLRDDFLVNGLSPPAERSCFIWLPGCYNLAKHDQILHVVKEAIGPDVLLYGMTMWDGENQALKQFHRDTQVSGCQKTLTFVSGTHVQLISESYKISERLLPVFLKILTRMEDESMKYPSKAEQVANFNKLFEARLKRLVRSAELRLESFEGEDGDGVFMRGGTIFRLGQAMEGRRGLLMQFISADCKVRESQKHSWGVQGTSYSLYMPPVLLVAGFASGSSQVNDVRLALVEETRNVNTGFASILGSSLGSKTKPRGLFGSSKMHEMVVFSETNTSVSWQERGIWRFRKVGEASTTVMSSGRLEQFQVSKKFSATKSQSVTSAGEQVIVVLREGLLYSRWVSNAGRHYCEVLELRPGSAVLLPSQFLHALKPLGHDTAFMSFSWVAHADEKRFGEPRHSDQFKISGFRKDSLDKELLGHGNTKATEGCTISLSSGQAYDPDNNENCDVLVFVIEGSLLQILPSNVTLESLDVLLIPADQSCVLWNVGSKPVRLFAMHLCHFNDAMQLTTSYGASGKIF